MFILKKSPMLFQFHGLRKDFTVDEYMIYEAKLLGASAVLLICSILSREQISEYIGICDSLGMSALVEAHDGNEVETALSAGARIIGVNNRNLKDFTVDSKNSCKLRKLIPPEVLFVSESGVKSCEDVKKYLRYRCGCCIDRRNADARSRQKGKACRITEVLL